MSSAYISKDPNSPSASASLYMQPIGESQLPEVGRSRVIHLSDNYKYLKGYGEIKKQTEAILFRLEFNALAGTLAQKPFLFRVDDFEVIARPSYIRPMFVFIAGI